MKPATLLALPALALAAATPNTIEERQLPSLPSLPINTTCVLGITGITSCVNIDPTNPPAVLSDLIGLTTCSLTIILRVVGCILPPIPAKN